MKNLTKEELNTIEGGLLKTSGTWIIVGAISSLIIGIINGVIRPLPCQSKK